MESRLEEILNGVGASAPAPQLGLLSGLVANALHSAGPGLIGVRPSPGLEGWQQEHPVLDVASSLSGLLVPYIGWEKYLATPVLKGIAGATRGEGLLGRAATTGLMEPTAPWMLDAPFKAAAAKEMMRFLPFEASRVAGAGFLGQSWADANQSEFEGMATVATQSAADLALLGLGAGAFGKFASLGKKYESQDLSNLGLDQSKSVQERLKQALQKRESGEFTVDDVGLEGLRRQIRREGIPSKTRFLQSLAEPGADGAERELSRVAAFSGDFSDTTNFVKSKLLSGIETPLNGELMENIMLRAEFPSNWEQYTQWPRYISAKTEAGEKQASAAIKRALQPLDSEKGLFYAQEKESGLFAMAKKIGEREWLFWKTDNPAIFSPTRAEFVKRSEEAAARGFERIDVASDPAAGKLWEHGANAIKVPAISIPGTDLRQGAIAKGTGAFLKSTGLDAHLEKGSVALEGAHQWARDYWWPAAFQMAGRALPTKLLSFARNMKDKAEGLAEEAFFGARALSRKGGLAKALAVGGEVASKDNLHSLFMAMKKDPEGWRKFLLSSYEGLSPAQAVEKFGLEGKGLDLLKRLQAVDAEQVAAVAAVEAKTGRPVTKFLEGHNMLSHFWKGQHVVPIYEDSKVIGYITHDSKNSAEEIAKQYISNARKQNGVEWYAGKPMPRSGDFEQDLKLLSQLDRNKNKLFEQIRLRTPIKGSTPATLEHVRTGKGGYVGDPLLRELTPDQAASMVLNQLRRYNKYQSEMIVEHMGQTDMNLVATYAPRDAEMVHHRIGAMFGRQGDFSKATEKFMDKALSPFLGRNSAMKMVHSVNRWKTRTTLGFWNLGYNIANILTPLQTTLPHMMWLTTAHPEQLSKYYTYFPVLGQSSVNTLGHLNVWKVVGESFKSMRKPDELLWQMVERGAREGVTDPRFLEEYLGQTAAKASNMRGALAGEQPMSEFFKAVADFLPGTSERFSRGYSFVLWQTFWKNVAGVKDTELLYQLTKQAVENTNFLYSAGDRAKIITGPLGTGAGLFKNWIMHYMGWMGEYAKEGFMRGNWKPMLYMMGGTTVGAGAASTPIWWAADTMSKWFTDKTALENLYSMRDSESKYFEDIVYFGLPGMLSFSLQNQMQMPGTDPGEDAAHLFSIVHWDTMKYLGRAVGTGFDHWRATGESPFKDPRMIDQLNRALMPKFLYRQAQITQEDVLKSLNTGYPSVSGVSLWEKQLYWMGLNPTNVEKQMAVTHQLWKDREARYAAIQAYGEEWASAQQRGDIAMAQNILARAMTSGLDVSSVLRSANARLAKMNEDQINRSFSPEQILRFQQVLGR